MQDQLTCMAQQLTKISNIIESIQLGKNNKASLSHSQEDEIEQLCQNITYSNALFKLKYLETNYQLDMIIWIPRCAWKKQAPKHLVSSIKSLFGDFQHIECKTDEAQSQIFRSLKTNIRLQFFNKLYLWELTQ
ncbi:unnamed protein product [Rotaria sp. Silwood2]|nr:unnamed protein product [Rotaria sp. Silwood2]CAF4260800.1 unnamed protein product [Rotaria sp. Silwood2]